MWVWVLFLFAAVVVNAEFRKAGLTWYTSYPACCNDPQAPDQDECTLYNGCKWAGWFAGLPDKQTEEWVKSHDIVAFYDDHNPSGSLWKKKYANKWVRLQFTLRNGTLIDFLAQAVDTCANSDCNKCCKRNSRNGFLVDVEQHTARRHFGRDFEKEVFGLIKFEFQTPAPTRKPNSTPFPTLS